MLKATSWSIREGEVRGIPGDLSLLNLAWSREREDLSEKAIAIFGVVPEEG